MPSSASSSLGPVFRMDKRSATGFPYYKVFLLGIDDCTEPALRECLMQSRCQVRNILIGSIVAWLAVPDFVRDGRDERGVDVFVLAWTSLQARRARPFEEVVHSSATAGSTLNVTSWPHKATRARRWCHELGNYSAITRLSPCY